MDVKEIPSRFTNEGSNTATKAITEPMIAVVAARHSDMWNKLLSFLMSVDGKKKRALK